VVNSTFNGNTATNGGGVYGKGTMVTANVLSPDAIAGSSYTDNGGSIIAGVNGVTSSNINLAPLGYYGGPAQTVPPVPGQRGHLRRIGNGALARRFQSLHYPGGYRSARQSAFDDALLQRRRGLRRCGRGADGLLAGLHHVALGAAAVWNTVHSGSIGAVE